VTTVPDGEVRVRLHRHAWTKRAGSMKALHTVRACCGRLLGIDDLDLEVAGVVRTAAGVSVNDYLQSVSNPSVYAAATRLPAAGFR